MQLGKSPQLAFRDYVGEERYERFRNTLAGTCVEKGRLLHWQKEIWREFCEKHDVFYSEDLGKVGKLFYVDIDALTKIRSNQSTPSINTRPITATGATISLALAPVLGLISGALFWWMFAVTDPPVLEESNVPVEQLANLLRFFGVLLIYPLTVIGLVLVPIYMDGLFFEKLGVPSKRLRYSVRTIATCASILTAALLIYLYGFSTDNF